jgi:3-hydroxyacyl-[acyl-carrier-protein] dehydratase
MRYYLIDKIDEIRYGDHIIAAKCVSLSDDIFNEHFPGYPIYPGSLILEALAQTAGSLFELTMMNSGKEVLRCVLSIITKFKFRNPAYPGDKIILKASCKSVRDDSGIASVSAEIDGVVCAEGELIFTFHRITNKTLEESRNTLYQFCTRNTKIIP